jgi:16S rRNA (cytosine1402-N4)-methyltransferase
MDTPQETKVNTQMHIPVLLDATLEYLKPEKGNTYLDLTAGYGGHAAAILERTQSPNGAILIDRDQMAIETLQAKFAATGTKILKKDFYTASQELKQAGHQYDIILADLGVSSPHLDRASRGFAFMHDGPLDMRMDQSQALTAEEIVNRYGEDDLANLLWKYGEEPKSRRIARLIIENRPLLTTQELAKTVAKAYPGYSRSHPATRTFQALRIAVNDELELLRRSLPLWFSLLAPGGRLGVISFHSLEDRIVKDAFREVTGDLYDAELRLLTKRPVVGDKHELVFNPRARSAKLRVVQRK